MKQLLKIHFLLLCVAVTMSACTDDNIAGDQPQGDHGATVNFNVSIAQDKMLQQQQKAPTTRATVLSRLAEEGLTLEDLVTHKYTVQGAPDLCLIETTVEGVNPVLPSADTRANVKTSIDGTFTSLGYRSDATGFSPDKPDWFYNAPTNSNGTLVTPLQWAWTHRYGRFYAVFPEAKTENKITFSPASYSGTPYVEFEAEQDVKKQKDLMTACSGEVEYQTRGVAPQTNLEFYHALTAVRFAVGQNLSWNKRIAKVEIKNAYSKGRYTLPTEFNGKGSWVDGSLTDRKDFTLDVSTTPVYLNLAPNTVIMGNPMDNYTFYMLPQDLSGVTVVITLESTHPGSTAPNTITIPLTGKWKAGTSKTYKLSQNTSDWTYHLTVTQPSPAAYDATQTGAYGVTSYKQAPDGTQQPVAWKVLGYDNNNDGTFSMTEKPAWLTGLSKTEGDGGTVAETGTANVTKDITDLLAKRNKDMKEATERGIPSYYYDLSTHKLDGTVIPRSTANCYIISAPGYYKIPLVYGNAITNGMPNSSAYTSSVAATGVLQILHDHTENNITNPWIEKTRGGAYSGIDGAKIVWADEANLITDYTIEHDANGAYLQFKVDKNNIKTGNVVVAATKSGTVVWSWHLWFTAPDVLDKTSIVNYQNHTYDFTKETLGWKYTSWNGSTYDQARSVKVKVAQNIGQGHPMNLQEAVITITQNPGEELGGSCTLYQWGRKDAFPSREAIAEGSFIKNPGAYTTFISDGIKNPEKFYNASYPTYLAWNLWSVNATDNTFNDNPVVKTVYDPCPAGFHMPASNAFTGFSLNGQNYGGANVDGVWHHGWNFKSKAGSNSNKVFLPASGLLGASDGLLYYPDTNGCYATALGGASGYCCCMDFTYNGYVVPLSGHYNASGFAVRPVAE